LQKRRLFPGIVPVLVVGAILLWMMTPALAAPPTEAMTRPSWISGTQGDQISRFLAKNSKPFPDKSTVIRDLTGENPRTRDPDPGTPGVISGTGTIRFINLEGGFYGIITPSGERYLPLNLPAGFGADGTEVTFTALTEEGVATISMWGTPVRIVSMVRTGQDKNLLQGTWYLTTYTEGSSQRAPIPGTQITADFTTRGTVTGTAGCNHYFAGCKATGSSLAVGVIGSTKIYCSSPEGAMQQEKAYFSLLSQAASWSLQNGDLVIRNGAGDEILRYTRDSSRSSYALDLT
jgi:heat shock protein HslJ